MGLLFTLELAIMGSAVQAEGLTQFPCGAWGGASLDASGFGGVGTTGVGFTGATGATGAAGGAGVGVIGFASAGIDLCRIAKMGISLKGSPD